MNAFQNGRTKAEAAIQQRLGNAQRTPEYAASLGKREAETMRGLWTKDDLRDPKRFADMCAIQMGLNGLTERKHFVAAFLAVPNTGR